MIKIKNNNLKVKGDAATILSETAILLNSLKEEFGEEKIDEIYNLSKLDEKGLKKEAIHCLEELSEKLKEALNKDEDNN